MQAIKRRGQKDLTPSEYGSSTDDQRFVDNKVTETSPEYPLFALYALLEGKMACIVDRVCTHDSAKEISAMVTTSLISIYNTHLHQQNQPDGFSLKALWHSIFIILHCNMNKLECAIGREGFDKAQEHHDYAATWASSVDGHRCAIHAALILRHLQRIQIGQEPAIHVPRLLYRAALVWYAYTRFGRDVASEGSSPSSAGLEFPELVNAGIDGSRVLFVANGFKKTRPTTSESSTLFHLIDLLTRLGHWGISQKMATLFSVLTQEKPLQSYTGI